MQPGYVPLSVLQGSNKVIIKHVLQPVPVKILMINLNLVILSQDIVKNLALEVPIILLTIKPIDNVYLHAQQHQWKLMDLMENVSSTVHHQLGQTLSMQTESAPLHALTQLEEQKVMVIMQQENAYPNALIPSLVKSFLQFQFAFSSAKIINLETH